MLNDNLRCFEELNEVHRKLEAKVRAYKHKLDDAKENYTCDQEKLRHLLDVIIE